MTPLQLLFILMIMVTGGILVVFLNLPRDGRQR